MAMKTYPLFMLLDGAPVLVVGGGYVAARKVEALLEAGAQVKVVTIEADQELKDLAANGSIHLELRPYENGEAARYILTIASTDNPGVNTQIANDSRGAGKLVNIVDKPALCNFIVPSVIRRGDLTVAISTGGASPALSRRLREKLEKDLPANAAELLALMAELRSKVSASTADLDERKRILTEAVNGPEFDSFLNGDEIPLKELVQKWT